MTKLERDVYDEIADILEMTKAVTEDDDIYTCEQAMQLIAENIWAVRDILNDHELELKMWRERDRIATIKAKLEKEEG